MPKKEFFAKIKHKINGLSLYFERIHRRYHF
jgi:hypothetical protein